MFPTRAPFRCCVPSLVFPFPFLARGPFPVLCSLSGFPCSFVGGLCFYPGPFPVLWSLVPSLVFPLPFLVRGPLPVLGSLSGCPCFFVVASDPYPGLFPVLCSLSGFPCSFVSGLCSLSGPVSGFVLSCSLSGVSLFLSWPLPGPLSGCVFSLLFSLLPCRRWTRDLGRRGAGPAFLNTQVWRA